MRVVWKLVFVPDSVKGSLLSSARVNAFLTFQRDDDHELEWLVERSSLDQP